MYYLLESLDVLSDSLPLAFSHLYRYRGTCINTECVLRNSFRHILARCRHLKGKLEKLYTLLGIIE